MGHLVALAFFIFPSLVWAQFTLEQQAAKSHGMFLYNLKRGSAAEPSLGIAADAGDAQSQYFLGEIERKRANFLTDKAQHWYELAAGQDHIYAMMRLFDVKLSVCKLLENCSPLSKEGDEWRSYAKALATQQADHGDGKAMFQLFLMTGSFHRLIQSADAGFPEAQHWLAIQYRQGKEYFLTPARRQRRVEQLLLSAAESNYVPAMDDVRKMLSKKGDKAGVVIWTERTAKAGGLEAMEDYAAWMANTSDYYKYPLDLVKAYGLALVLASTELPSRRITDRLRLDEIAKNMTQDQIAAGNAFAEEWKNTYSPLSRFPVDYGP